ncbi:hypothetical protein BKA82DRAFT_4212657 [Pisolithus tinctorius]|nr:hypothetical protein BKA82DRAFT_4212657 [Pisolithus tinctorius]
MVHIVDLSMFSAERLAHPVGLAEALRHLELLLVVSNTDGAVAQIVRELLSVPNLFGFLISVWPNSKKLVERIFSAFPKEPALIPQSFVKDLLFKISHTLFSIPPALLSTDLSKNIGQFRQYVDNVLPVLAMLCCADFASETSITEEHAELVDEDIPFFKQKVKKQRRRVKQAAAAVDPALFFKLGVPVPTTNEAARRMATDIAEKLKLVLDSYLSALSSPELAMPLKNAYVQHLSDHSTSERLRTVVKPSTSVAVETQPSAYPTVQPMKAALYFDNADGFGEWRVLIGTDVTKKLTEFRENDRQKFKIVVKKIKELSHGRFSDDNQKRLEEESAAGLIQRVYRQHREKQRRLLERPTLEAERSAIYATCLKHAQDTGFAPGFYRLLYLGPLPHLLLALKKGIIMATFVRDTTKIPGLLLKEGHEHLEELGRNRSEISWTLKQGHELLKKLSPDSQFHKNRDIGALKDAVLQVKEFLHRIPGGARGSPEELNIAYKAIVAEKHVPKKEKPSLNVEDLDPYEY